MTKCSHLAPRDDPHAEREDYTVSFLANLFARLFDLADFVAQLGRPLVLFAGDRLFHFPPQPNQLRLFLGAPGTELRHFAYVPRFPVNVEQQWLELLRKANVIVRATEPALFAEL